MHAYSDKKYHERLYRDNYDLIFGILIQPAVIFCAITIFPHSWVFNLVLQLRGYPYFLDSVGFACYLDTAL